LFWLFILYQILGLSAATVGYQWNDVIFHSNLWVCNCVFVRHEIYNIIFTGLGFNYMFYCMFTYSLLICTVIFLLFVVFVTNVLIVVLLAIFFIGGNWILVIESWCACIDFIQIRILLFFKYHFLFCFTNFTSIDFVCGYLIHRYWNTCTQFHKKRFAV